MHLKVGCEPEIKSQLGFAIRNKPEWYPGGFKSYVEQHNK